MQTNTDNNRIDTTSVLAKQGKKILFATVPADGHFNPLTGLAKHLEAAGHEVGWYCAGTYAKKLKKLSLRHFPFTKALEVTSDNIEDIFPARSKIKNKIKRLNFDIINFFIARAEEYYADLKDIRKDFPFDLVVADVAFTAIPFIKDKMNIPVIGIGVFPLTETSADLPPAGLGMQPCYTIAGKIKQSLLRFAADKLLFKTANNVMKKLLNKYGIVHNDCNVFDLLIKKTTLMLQSGTPGFEYFRSDIGSNVRFIGSLLPYNDGRQNEQWFDKRMNQYERIILVTQGTVEKDIEKILVPTLEAFKHTKTLVIATTGGSRTQELKSRYPQRNYIIEDFIPFDDVMPYADVYVTNGGYGGVMLSIENKLPIVGAGVHEGKNEINARVAYFRLGVDLRTESPKPEQLRAAIEQVIVDKTYKQNVIKLSEEFSKYDPYALCAGYVEDILSAPTNIIAALKGQSTAN
jgi:MGT family glycosyltransferase